jgi:hypothetical protein
MSKNYNWSVDNLHCALKIVKEDYIKTEEEINKFLGIEQQIAFSIKSTQEELKRLKLHNKEGYPLKINIWEFGSEKNINEINVFTSISNFYHFRQYDDLIVKEDCESYIKFLEDKVKYFKDTQEEISRIKENLIALYHEYEKKILEIDSELKKKVYGKDILSLNNKVSFLIAAKSKREKTKTSSEHKKVIDEINKLNRNKKFSSKTTTEKLHIISEKLGKSYEATKQAYYYKPKKSGK